MFRFIPVQMPLEFIQEIESWPVVHQSPYSNSYYNLRTGEKTWDHTPEGSLRISDHWNFPAHGSIHCRTDRPVRMRKWWTLAQWRQDRYIVLKTLPRRTLTEINDDEAHRLAPFLQKRRLEAFQARAQKLAQVSVMSGTSE
jgi:hypothetical protein